jgi:RND superfamily putative drug exporter
MFARIGRFVVGRPWLVIGFWLVAAVAVAGLSPSLPSSAAPSDFLPGHYEAIQALKLQQSAFPNQENPSAVGVVQRTDRGPLTDADAAVVQQAISTLKGKQLHLINDITTGPPAANKLVQLILIQMPARSNDNAKQLREAHKVLRTQARDVFNGTGLTIEFTGAVPTSVDLDEQSSKADAIVLLATLLLIFTLLIVIFRSPIIALLPVVLITVVYLIANGLTAIATRALHLTTDPSLSQILIVVLFGIGTDYILFLLFRFRERLRDGVEPRGAIIGAVQRVGAAIASAAGVVIAAMLAMMLSDLGMFRAMGPGLAISVAVALLAGLTLVPATVSLLGTKVFWPSRSWRHQPRTARFGAIGSALARRPAVFAGAACLVLIALALPALGAKHNFDLTGSLPRNAESQVAARDLQRSFPLGTTDPTYVFVHNTAGQHLDKDQITAYGAKLGTVGGVAQVNGPQLSPDGATALFALSLNWDPNSAPARIAVGGPIRDAAHRDAPAGTTALVGGTSAQSADLDTALKRDYRVVFTVAALIIMLILGLMLRSLVAPLYLMVAVGLGFLATLGATVVGVQHVRAEPGLPFVLPMLIYMFVVAVGTDYNILMVSRLREEMRAGRSPQEAAAIALRRAGPTIGAAGLILAGSFAALMLANNEMLSAIGFAVGFGIFLTAFVMAMFLTPGITVLLGRRAWWPGHREVAPAEAPRTDVPDAPDPVEVG